MAIITINNQAAFNKGIEEFIKHLQQATSQTVQELGALAVETAQNTTAFRNTLKESTHFVSNGEYVGEVIDDRSYAYYLEFGNNQGGDRIYPTHSKALHFFINGEEIFAKSVAAHGAYLFITNGRNQAEDRIEEVFTKYLED